MTKICPLEIAKKLKSLGIQNDTYAYYIGAFYEDGEEPKEAWAYLNNLLD